MLTRREPLEARRATFTRLIGKGTSVIDEVVVTYFPAPHSYTGEPVVEISAHGNPVVLRAIVGRALEVGARLAEPGEFTLRAFLNGQRDLVQAEAVGDPIAAATPVQARVACDQLEGTLTQHIADIDAELFPLIARLEASLDFPDEGYHFIESDETGRRLGTVVRQLDHLLAGARRGRLIREGATVPLEVPVRCTCHTCGGRGETWTESCRLCRGSGVELLRHQLKVLVPAGVIDGTRYCFTVTPRHHPPTRIELRVLVA